MDKKETWLDLVGLALNNYEPPKGLKDDDLIDDMIDFSTEFADGLLDEFEIRFDSGSKGGAKRRKRKVRRREEEEPDPDDDD